MLNRNKAVICDLLFPIKEGLKLSEQWDAIEESREKFDKLDKVKIYFIRSGNHVKVGKSIDIEKRKSTLQTGNPHKLEELFHITSIFFSESEIQAIFEREGKKYNNEWFIYDDWMHGFLKCLKLMWDLLINDEALTLDKWRLE